MNRDTKSGSAAPGQVATRPGFLLRVFSGILLTRWVIKRVQHPDVLVIMQQLARQTGRTDAAELVTTKLRAFTK